MRHARLFFALLLTIICAARPAISAGAELRKTLNADSGGIGVISVTASTPGYQWSMEGPAPVLDVLLDGELVSNIVLFGGEKPFEYRLLAGAVAAGKHDIIIRPGAARKSAREYRIDGVVLKTVPPGSFEYEAYRHAPLLYGREENDISDTPLIMWSEFSPKNGTVNYKYSFTWSNEDGGTKTAALMALYGRTVDTEHAITVTVDASGRVTGETFQTFDHRVAAFKGTHDGERPILRDATKNNVFADTGTSSLLFSLAPDVRDPLPDVREVMLDAHTWIYRIMSEELIKEGKQSSGGPGADMAKAGDPRQYVYVDLNTAPAFPKLGVDVAVRLKGSGTWFSSARGVEDLSLDLTGWARVAIPVGRVPAPGDIAVVRVSLFDTSRRGYVSLRAVRRILVLDDTYTPSAIPIDWSGRVTLSPSKPEWILQIPNNTENQPGK